MVSDLAQVLRTHADGSEGWWSRRAPTCWKMTYLVHLLGPTTGDLHRIVSWNAFGSDAGISLRQAVMAASSTARGLGAGVPSGPAQRRRIASEPPPGRLPVPDGAPGEVSGDQIFIRRPPAGSSAGTARPNFILYAALVGERKRCRPCQADVETAGPGGLRPGKLPPPDAPPQKHAAPGHPLVITSRCHRPRVVPTETFEGGTAAF